MSSKLLTIADVVNSTTLSKASIYRGIKAGGFPEPVRIASRRVAWRETDICAWLDRQAGVSA